MLDNYDKCPASEMTYCVSGGTLNSTHSLTTINVVFTACIERSASRGIAIVSCSSVCVSVCLSATLWYRGHVSWVSLKVIIRVISLGSSLLGASTSAI